MQYGSHPRLICIGTREEYVSFPIHSVIVVLIFPIESSSHGHLVIYTCLHCKTSKVIPAPPTLPPSLGASTESRFEGSGTASTTAVHGTSESSDKPSSMADPQVQKEENKSRRRLPRPHLLPLFARPDVGHVVFRGNEVLDQQQGFGVCFI